MDQRKPSRYQELLAKKQKKEKYSPQKEMPTYCVFCKNNGESAKVYNSHVLKHNGKVLCPVLYNYICPNCGNSGDKAHTVRYCPYAEKNIQSQEKICKELKPFRTLDLKDEDQEETDEKAEHLDLNDNYVQANKTETEEFYDILAPFNVIERSNILGLYYLLLCNPDNL